MESQSDTDTESNNSSSFIKNSPIGEDQLEGKAQERIAESIAELIEKNETKNKLLGLDGDWGSGKSNLIKILEKKLSKTHHFFIYDAWGHQEDLQRRSFLEELTEDLCSCKDNVIDKPAKWKKKLKNLLARKRETKTKTIPRLSSGLIITILIAVFMPFAQTMSEIAKETWLKIIITLVPLGFGLLAYLFASLKNKRWLSLSDIYAVYKDEELRNKTHVTISEKEPSVKQFQNWITDLSDALTTKKLVIVFDNMDRLPPDKVRELWPSIYKDGRFKNIWVIVPFDGNHISAAFEGESTTSKDKDKKSEEFLYRVAPPVVTDWKKFLNDKLKEAFGESEQQEELDYVRKIFGRLQKDITPRNIIAFINEIASLRQISKEEIRLRYMAVFVLAKKEILSDPVDKILNDEVIDSLSLGDIGSFYKFYGDISKEKPIKAIKPDQLECLFRTVKIKSEDLPELLAMILANPESWDINGLIKKIEGSLNNTDADSVKDIINPTAERIEYYENYGTLLLNYLNRRRSPLKAVLREITMNPPHEDSNLDSAEMLKILKRYSDLQSLLEVPHKDFLNRLSRWTEHAQEQITAKNILNHLTDPALFQYALEVDCSLSVHLLETMIEKLNSLSTDECQDALQNEESFIYKVTDLFIKNIKRDGSSHFKDIVRRKMEAPTNKDLSPFAKAIGVQVKKNK